LPNPHQSPRHCCKGSQQGTWLPLPYGSLPLAVHGVADGAGVGISVGAAVGAGVGAGDGAAVGVGVGETTAHSDRQR